MIYVRNDKRYTENALTNQGIISPLDNGFEYLKDSQPPFDHTTEKAVDVGTKDGAVLYEVRPLCDEEIQVVKNQINKPVIEQIKEIETEKLPRALSDAANGDNTFLVKYREEIQSLRDSLV